MFCTCFERIFIFSFQGKRVSTALEGCYFVRVAGGDQKLNEVASFSEMTRAETNSLPVYKSSAVREDKQMVICHSNQRLEFHSPNDKKSEVN